MKHAIYYLPLSFVFFYYYIIDAVEWLRFGLPKYKKNLSFQRHEEVEELQALRHFSVANTLILPTQNFVINNPSYIYLLLQFAGT